MKKIKKEKINVWLITGCSFGFGRAICEELLKRDYKVIATSRNIDKLNYLVEFATKINKKDNLLIVSLDVKNKDQIKNVVKLSLEKFDKIDVLVNNAGITFYSTFEEATDEEARNVFDTNFWGAYNMISEILPEMRKNHNGTIINITSIRGIQPRKLGSHYSASKFALEGLSGALRFETQNFCRVMAVEFGAFDTGINSRSITNEVKIDEYKNIPDYCKINYNFTNEVNLAVKSIIDVVEREKIPQRLPLGRDSYIIVKNEINRLKEDLKSNKNLTLSCSIYNNTTIKLFNFIPLLKIKRKTNKVKYYLFGFIPIINKKI